jgi:uncharacterized protein (DUF433 family)
MRSHVGEWGCDYQELEAEDIQQSLEYAAWAVT